MRASLTLLAGLGLLAGPAVADPCGMVPPIRISDADGPAIQRTGAQRTYVMFKDGVETMALRPGFVGKVDDFGMLIPFPTAPAIRKIEDDTFAHLEAAIDPPEMTVTVYDYLPRPSAMASGGAPRKQRVAESAPMEGLGYMEVNVVREEAVGMYQVAVLEAGSPKALSKWMDENGYRYPEGMDDTVRDYVEARWCFVAIKATVGAAPGVTPQPGMRGVDSKLPEGASFDGHVQGMGFRFRTDSPVIPMRLSVFNPDDSGDGPRNVVYALTEGPVKIAELGDQLVQRQVAGPELHDNLTELIDINWVNGGPEDASPAELKAWEAERDPARYSGIARDLIASDLLAASAARGGGELSLPHEEEEKELLRISEAFGLRGAEIDAQHAAALEDLREAAVADVVGEVEGLTLSVIDGQFPVAVLAEQNLTLSGYELPAKQNVARVDPLRPVAPSKVIYRER